MTNGNDLAYPSDRLMEKSFSEEKYYGLTKREYFAAMAMQGMAASNYWAENFNDQIESYMPAAMKVAVKAADALITALNEQP